MEKNFDYIRNHPEKVQEIFGKYSDKDHILYNSQGKILIFSYEYMTVLVCNNKEEYEVFERFDNLYDEMNHPNIVKYHRLAKDFRFKPSQEMKQFLSDRLNEIKQKADWGNEKKEKEFRDKFENKEGIDYCLIEELIPLSIADFTGPTHGIKNDSIGQEHEIMKRFDMEYQVLKGLQYLHDHGITHFDVKDGNFQIMPNGKVVFIDFNISKFTNQKHYFGGTKDWTAPEVAERKADIDQLSDMYAVYLLFNKSTVLDDSLRDKNNRKTPWERIKEIQAISPELVGFPQYAEMRRESPKIIELNVQTDGVKSLPKDTMKANYQKIMNLICNDWLELSSEEKAYYAQMEVKENLREEAEISDKFEKLKKDADEFEKEANKKIYNLFQKIIAAQAETEAIRAVPDPEEIVLK